MAILVHLQDRTEKNQRESIFRLKCCACHALKKLKYFREVQNWIFRRKTRCTLKLQISTNRRLYLRNKSWHIIQRMWIVKLTET